MSEVLVDRTGAVTTITLNNPKKRNPLSLSMMTQLREAFEQVGGTDTFAVVLAANGPMFSAGHNLAEMVGMSAVDARNLVDACVQLVQIIQGIPQPVIARVHAGAVAAGCQLVASCDLAVAGESATFAMPGIKRGLFCHTPLVAVSRVIGARHALEMAMTGEPITARQAADWGLVNYTVPDDALGEATESLVHRIIDGGSAYARALGKRCFYDSVGLPQPQAYDLAAQVMATNALLPDAQEGFAAFAQKREPRFTSTPLG
jgi:enoyl-CoA hydratase/carnithine racemase